MSRFDDIDLLDDFYDEDEEELPRKKKTKTKLKSTTKVKTKQKSKAQKTKNQYEEYGDDSNYEDSSEKKGISKGAFIGSVIGTFLVSGLIMGGAGYVIGTSSAPQQQTEQAQPEEAKPTHVLTLADSLKTIKDEQIKVLQNQIAVIDKVKNEAGGEIKTEDMADLVTRLAKSEKAVVENIDVTLDKLFAVKRYATDTDKDLVKKAMADNVYDKSDTMIYNTLNGLYPAKDLDKDGIKSGATFASMLTYTPKGDAVYFTITPFTTTEEKKTYQIAMLVATNSENKVTDLKYLGYYNDKNSESLYFTLDKYLKIPTKNINEKATETTEKTTETKKEEESSTNTTTTTEKTSS